MLVHKPGIINNLGKRNDALTVSDIMTSSDQVSSSVPRKSCSRERAISLETAIMVSHLSTPGLALRNVPVVLQFNKGCVLLQDTNLPQLRRATFLDMVGW